jgi:DNA-binding transcriptional MocR family regulator
MVFDLNRQDEQPLYEQIRQRISGLIDSGALAPSERLPATRDLARALGVNRNTVVRAYADLEVDGKVTSGVGRGTFVAEFVRPAKGSAATAAVASADFEGLWSRSLLAQDDGGFVDLIRGAHSSEATVLSSCLPDKTLFPMREFRNCAYWALQNYGTQMVELNQTQGFVPFLEHLPKYLLRHGLQVEPNHLIMTNGIQQGIDLVARALVNPGDLVITEELTYPRAISALRGAGAELLGVALDAQGMKVEILEQVVARRRPKLIYTIPTFQNPTGTTMSEERRRRRHGRAAQHKIPILEDHFANYLRLDGKAVLPLAALDRHGWVIGVGSLSKVLFHGLRLGWILTPIEPLRRRLISLKQTADLQTSYLAQGIILEFMRRGFLEKYLKRRLAQLRGRREAMRRALAEYLPEGARWYDVEGGVCFWLTLPSGMRADEVLLEARKRGVVVAPKHFFSVNPSANDGMRLGFTDLTEEKARHGVRVIGQIVRELEAGVSRPPMIEERGYARVHV